MNTIALSIFLLSCVALCYGTSHPIVRNTKTEVCVKEDCKIVCAWDGVEVAEGELLNEPKRCRLLECSNDGLFTLVVTACPLDTAGRYKWVGQNATMPYPDCCGEKVAA